MSFISFFTTLLIVVGIILFIIGIKHHKSWIWGIMLIIVALIVKAFLWLTSMF